MTLCRRCNLHQLFCFRHIIKGLHASGFRDFNSVELMEHLHTTDQLILIRLEITILCILYEVADLPTLKGHVDYGLINTNVSGSKLCKEFCLTVYQVACCSSVYNSYIADIIWSAV